TNTNTYIDLNIQKKIFDPFYQGEHRTEAKGSGLGLSIVKYLVEMHQGRIDIISEPEKNGSGAFNTFIITLPGREIRAASNSITINTSAAVKKKIVVAEDHGELRNVLVEH